MNFMDYCFITILILSGLAGAYQGLVRSLIGMVGVFFTFFVSLTQYDTVANAIKESTPIYEVLKESSIKTLNSAPGLNKISEINAGVINSLFENFNFPPVLKNVIANTLNVSISNINAAQLIDLFCTKAADIFVNVLGFIIIFATIQFLFVLIQNALSTIFSVPILNEVNIIGGFGIGVIQGIITLFVICAAWSMFSGSMMYREVFADLNASKYAKVFYNHNFLLYIFSKYLY